MKYIYTGPRNILLTENKHSCRHRQRIYKYTCSSKNINIKSSINILSISSKTEIVPKADSMIGVDWPEPHRESELLSKGRGEASD